MPRLFRHPECPRVGGWESCEMPVRQNNSRLQAGAAKPASSSSCGLRRAVSPKAAPLRPVAAPSSIDAAMFDELTDGDLKPVSAVAMSGQSPGPSAGAAGQTAKLLQQHAATAGGTSEAKFRVGPVASPWVRLGAAIIRRVCRLASWPFRSSRHVCFSLSTRKRGKAWRA